MPQRVAEPRVWGHDGCNAYYRIKLTSCPRHRGAQQKEMTMPKITRHGGPTNFGLNERDAGFIEPALTPPADWVRPQNQADADLQAGAPAVPVDDERTATEFGGREAGSDWEQQDAGEGDQLEHPEPVEAPFNPGDYSVKDVVAELEGLDAGERNAVIEAERAGKARPGILKA